MPEFINLEDNMNVCASLINIIKTYCEFNYDKSEGFIVLADALEIVEKRVSDSIKQLDQISEFITK